eukprot:CAMPEP_0202706350 /NCGR_PEP_ID=MMETSP1385-20130828/18782_1 /ASSEMBLY_ACC=CAM_ASM_000861 /TAXON_ID=933848 /ORGANISM="Elphidium margaritaceum" /LENGTH=60 /DNA_ID=CAMNT_0049364797 /DNA_START=70 /DNA_END=248 /DNA_ORIENTATION=-
MSHDSDLQHHIESLLADIDLTEKRDAYASTLSGGQQRKLSLLMAFVGEPRVIFLDEPSSG